MYHETLTCFFFRDVETSTPDNKDHEVLEDDFPLQTGDFQLQHVNFRECSNH